MTNYDYILKLLNIKDTDIEINKIDFIDNTYYIHIYKNNLGKENCPNCGSNSITTNNTYIRKVKDNPINGCPSYILFHQKRLKCNLCSKSFNQSNTFVHKGCNISIRTKNLIINESTLKQSFKDVSRRTNVSETTVSNEFKKKIHDYRCSLTRIICIDEFKASTLACKYALIIGDPTSGNVLDILPSRLQDYIYHYFDTINDNERSNVEFVVTDLFESYRTIVKNLFWNSIHVADKFHWVKLAVDAFNKTRISIMKYYKATKNSDSVYYASILKKHYKLLLVNKYAKESWFFDQNVSSNRKQFTTYQSVIDYCIEKNANFCEAYHFLQELYRISKYSSYQTAKRDILNWCMQVEESDKAIPEFKKIVLIYRAWIDEIVNSFIIDPITHKRLSNGFIEGKNNLCKVIKRIGFGYSDFDVYRYKIINCNKQI